MTLQCSLWHMKPTRTLISFSWNHKKRSPVVSGLADNLRRLRPFWPKQRPGREENLRVLVPLQLAPVPPHHAPFHRVLHCAGAWAFLCGGNTGFYKESNILCLNINISTFLLFFELFFISYPWLRTNPRQSSAVVVTSYTLLCFKHHQRSRTLIAVLCVSRFGDQCGEDNACVSFCRTSVSLSSTRLSNNQSSLRSKCLEEQRVIKSRNHFLQFNHLYGANILVLTSDCQRPSLMLCSNS